MIDLSKNKGRKWTTEEIDYLKDNYGGRKTHLIAKDLNRTIVAVRKKARLLFPNLKFHEVQCNYSIGDLSEAFGVASSVIYEKWVCHRGLPTSKHKSKKLTYHVIKLERFWDWLENNKNNVTIHMSKVNLDVLEYYPDWFLSDFENKVDYLTKGRKSWSKSETNKLNHLYYVENKTATEIASILNRTITSVRKKLDRELKNKLTKIA